MHVYINFISDLCVASLFTLVFGALVMAFISGLLEVYRAVKKEKD